MSSRRRARELALRAAYALEMSGNPLHTIIEDSILSRGESARVSEFATALVKAIFEHRGELDRMIRARATNWDFERIAVLDRLILRLAVCEFLFFEDIPPKVTIDEAIEIAKKYSTEKSGTFINGILDGILADLRAGDRLRKSGRGLNDGQEEPQE
jgi:N utilization substance protein B